jgi:hypothetical protein
VNGWPQSTRSNLPGTCVDVDAAYQRREHRQPFLRRRQIKARAPWTDLDVLAVEVATIPAICQHDRTEFAAELGEFCAVLIVQVRHCRARRIGSASFEQHPLGGEVFVHGLVIIEMIAREIREHSDVEGDSVDSLLRQRV